MRITQRTIMLILRAEHLSPTRRQVQRLQRYLQRNDRRVPPDLHVYHLAVRRHLQRDPDLSLLYND